jgi:biopolymer transport protein ExbB
MKRLIALVVLLLVLPASAQAWWNEEWTVRKKITLDTQAAAVPVEVDVVPVLVRLSTGNFDFLSAKEDGSDIRFVAEDDTTPLKFHIERYDGINELAFLWVQVPKLAGNKAAQSIWLYYGNAQAAAADSKASNDYGYDTSQLLVYHLNETQGVPQDATANGTHASTAKLAYVSGSLIAGGAKLAGDGGMVADSPALQAAREFTFSAWIKPGKADGELLALGGLTLNLSGGVPVLAVNGVKTRAAASIPLNAWHHIAVTGVFTGEQGGGGTQGFTLYVDGKSVVTTTGTLTPAASLRIGGGLVGEMDEVQVSTVARPAAWLAAQVESQGQAGRLVKYGEDETTDSSEGTSYFTTTMQNVTVDGWVVIIILAFMFVIAVWVMVTKALLLGRMEKANATFAEEFGKMSRGLAELDDSVTAHAGKMDHLAKMMDEFKHSSLYRIYHVGVTELKHRFPSSASAVGAPDSLPVISPQSINAVRASLDAQLVREGHRLNQAMVLLTIAISGGPFLGLLGTVVGVMITFAAIAATGDVNVNAIAPGIAAALVATVAGLAVAIPALFGYNYLTSKIKTISADMHIFVDEFITKMAENYGG